MAMLESPREHRHDRRSALPRDPHRAGRQRRLVPKKHYRQPILEEVTIGKKDNTLATPQRLDHPSDT